MQTKCLAVLICTILVRQPLFTVDCCTATLKVGYSWTQTTMYGLLPDRLWMFMLDYLIPLLLRLSAGLGVWIVVNIGRSERSSLMWPLIGAFAVYPPWYYDYKDPVFFMTMTISSSLYIDLFSNQWHRIMENIHILRWANIKQSIVRMNNFAQHYSWYELCKKIIEFSFFSHGEQNRMVNQVLCFSQDLSEQEIASTQRRPLDLNSDQVKYDGQPRATDHIEQEHERISTSSRSDEPKMVTCYKTSPVPIPVQKGNVQEDSESTPSLKHYRLHDKMHFTPDILDHQSNRAYHVDVESHINDCKSSTSESSRIFEISTDNSCNTTNNVVMTGNRSFIVNGSRNLLDESDNSKMNKKNRNKMRQHFKEVSTDYIHSVSSTTTQNENSSNLSKISDTKCIKRGFFKRPFKLLRRSRLSKVGRFLKRNIFKKQDITRFYGIKTHIEPIFGLASVLLEGSCKKCEKDDSVSSDSLSQSPITVLYDR